MFIKACMDLAAAQAFEGCIRIPAKLNIFLDPHGILDADYEQALASGKVLWVLNPKRQLVSWPGRYMVIIDSKTVERPARSPLPGAKPPPITVSAGDAVRRGEGDGVK